MLNTPSHHRVHHAANPEYLDRNYGGIFTVFDRLFGTFVSERDDIPCRYGLVTPLRSNNPVIIAFHEWAALARDLWRARSWRERLICLIGPPGPRSDVVSTKIPAGSDLPGSILLAEPTFMPTAKSGREPAREASGSR